MYKFYYTNWYGVTSYIRKSITSLWQIAWNPNIRKWLMRIKLTCLMLLIAFIQVSLAANAQKIFLSKKNAPLTEIFKELRKQSGYDFVINKDQINVAKPVTIVVNGDNLINVLNKCFEGQPFTYSMEDKMIIVVNKKPDQTLIKNYILNIDVSGKVLDEKGEPIYGASIKVKGASAFAITNKDGTFILKNIPEDAFLEISSLGYKMKEVKAAKQMNSIILEILIGELDEVNVVSTGYQTSKVNEINGTVSLISEKALNARSGSNILDRIIGQSSGLMLQVGKSNNNTQNKTNISIRGLGTINGPLDPLIVLDNFIYEGDISNINPNDVENISVLKDAAAASIWGARAGNGVIVITTKKGRQNQQMQVQFGASLLLQDLPNFNSIRQMNSGDYIAFEKQLFEAGYFNDRISTTPWLALTPVVEILLARRNGQISQSIADERINSLVGNNTQQSYLDNFYTNGILQQYNLNIKGGGDRNTYLLSAAYDQNRGETFNTSNKLNLHFANEFKLLEKLNLSTNVYYTNLSGKTGRPSYYSISSGGRYPTYLDFAQEGGLATGFRSAYTDTLAKGRLLDWKFYPTEDYKHDYTDSRSQDLFANVGIRFQILKGFNLQVNYQYQRQNSDSERTSDEQSYAARDLINSFSQVNPTTGVITYPVPRGGILNSSSSLVNSQTGRAQFNYNNIFGSHSISAILGAEARSANTSSRGSRRLGYQSDPLYFTPVDEVGLYRQYLTGFTSQIGSVNTLTQTAYRFISMYANFAYTFKGRYLLSGSIRRDGSNIFGADINDKWKPLWSTGLGWRISDEPFYNLKWLPVLRLTSTFGYSGNVDLTKTASPIAGYATNTVTGFPTTRINALNNPNLKWEQLSQVDMKLDFELSKQILTGAFSYYIKKGTDLYGITTYDYTTWGFREVITRNVANMRGQGIDLDLHSRNLKTQNLNWSTDLYFSYNISKTTKYVNRDNSSAYYNLLNGGNVISPIVGYPLYALSAFKWGGLDDKGNPQGYLKGKLSTDYEAIYDESFTAGTNATYMGPASPTYFGSLINTFAYKGLSISVNVNYKLGYKVKKPALAYSMLKESGQGNHEYSQRWQKSGDENFTNVPSFIYATNSVRDAFYANSEINVISGDHIRLDYIRLGYMLNLNQWKLPFSSLEVYSGLQNVGILWKANRFGYDPDYANVLPPSRQLTFGIRGSF
ncbi:MAG: SusC/RagA family TonB-linked outer membrane protein [Chryseobacterium sp.]|nr:MAG: SusC/RagA family TonB-linked outer membrane protein [Chryseobacterium sp.]